MDYFIIFLLIIIIFTFLSDKKLESISTIQSKISNLNKKINYIYNETEMIYLDECINNNSESIIQVVRKKLITSNKKYVFIRKQNVKLTNKTIRKVIANFIKENEKICGFMANYEYKYINHKKLDSIKDELKIAIINYINIFAKHDISTYGVIMLKSDELSTLIHNNKDKRNKIVLFSAGNEIKIDVAKTKSVFSGFVKIYDSDIKNIIKSALLIIVGVTVTANLVHSIYLFDIIQIIIAGMIYWCYSYVLKYMYKPIGKYKVMAKYLFPIFLAGYLLFQLLTISKRKVSNKKVQAS